MLAGMGMAHTENPFDACASLTIHQRGSVHDGSDHRARRAAMRACCERERGRGGLVGHVARGSATAARHEKRADGGVRLIRRGAHA